ncbi:MAG: DNA polymerase/3'-5' exonuclease PolX [Planctomycetes bacterium]|nr:DNA polymerase/3'-5' exonuclease PolX [Planctomycetota bacterium]
MTNADVARVFKEIGDMLEIQGADGFRVNSYRRVSRTIGDLVSDINDIAQRGELGKLAGVGKTSAAKIEELLKTGKLEFRERLAGEVPESLLQLLRIQSMGPKKVALLWKERGIESLSDLKQAIDGDRLDGLKGFGAKTVQQIRAGIEFLEGNAGRTLLGVALPVAESMADSIRDMPGVQRVEIAGSLRRGRETVGDLDLLCIADDGQAVIERFTGLSAVTRVLGAGKTKGSIICEHGGEQIQIDLRVVREQSFGAAWQYFTGSKEHNVRLRERAVKRGWSLNEYSLSDAKSEEVIASKSEEEIYAALDVPWIPPELREDRGELDLSETPELLTLDDIRGDLHMHTTASDGKNSIGEMAAAAKKLGYKYICITDHSQGSVIANGLKPDRLLAHIDAVRKVAGEMKGITVWVGAEVDILADGSLDYADELLAKLDWVVASVHMGMSQDVEANTRRTLAAIRNPYVNLIAHPTGRLLNRREAMPIDIEAIAKEAARTGTALEINAARERLDLKDQHARLARDLGAMICIDCDAHRVASFDQMRLGILTARRAGLRKADVLNTRSIEQISSFVQSKRDGGE